MKKVSLFLSISILSLNVFAAGSAQVTCFREAKETTSLSTKNIVTLCQKAEVKLESLKCFSEVHETTSLSDSDAVMLCAGASDHLAPQECYFDAITTTVLGNDKSLAAKLCSAK